MATETIGWGIVSTGDIATNMAGDLLLLEDSEITAVSSRTMARARTFADDFGIPSAYDAFTDLIAAPDVDVVYVATPHAQHPQIVEAALDAGKPVLVEKSMTTSLADTVALVERARERGVFLMEAMWTRFNPTIVHARGIIAEGGIGTVRSIHAELGFVMPPDPAHRLWDPRQGGGATLDLMIYPVAFAEMVLGRPDTVTATGVLSEYGVDTESGLLLGWADGARAFLESSMVTAQPGGAMIIGTEGRLEILPRFHHPDRMRHVRSVDRSDRRVEEHEQPQEGRGYVPMLRAVAQAVRQGRTECAEMPLDGSVRVMRILQQTLDVIGMVYPTPNPVVAHGEAVA